MDNVMECRNIGFSYNGTKVLEDIDIAVAPGGMLGILGANGAGKSTLLKILAGILRPNTGRVSFAGSDIGKIDRRAFARSVSYIPQDPSFAFPFSVREVVLMGRAPYIGRFEFEREADISLAESALDSVGIFQLRDRMINEISGGERQLVSIARALAQEPEVMILDEPATFLDLKHKTDILNILKKLREENNIAVICATHDVFSALMYFDELIMIKDGRSFVSGRTDKVVTKENLSAVYDIEVNVRKENGNIFVIPA